MPLKIEPEEPKILTTAHEQLVKQEIKSSSNLCHCDLCGAKFQRKNILRHIHFCKRQPQRNTSKSRPKNRFICFNCKTSFVSKQKLVEHADTHEEQLRVPYIKTDGKKRPFECSHCPWKFQSLKFRNDHVQRIHISKLIELCRGWRWWIIFFAEDRPFECDYPNCGKYFKTINEAKDHSKSVHITERPHACSNCTKSFKLIHHLKEHIIRVHEKPKERKVPCQLCKSMFYNKLDLKVHQKRSHMKKWLF